MNPVSLIYLLACFFGKEEKLVFRYYNFNTNILLVHLLIFVIFFLNPTSFIKKKLSPKRKTLSFLNISSIEIGTLYSIEDLKKYYEIKKLQLFNVIIDCNKADKMIDNYSNLINNYMFVIKYLKQNLEGKIKLQQNNRDISLEEITEENYPLKREVNIRNTELKITGDVSYNQSFIPKYEMYNNYSLMKNI